MTSPIGSRITQGTAERRRISQLQLATVRTIIVEAIQQKDFARMEHGFEVYQTIVDEQKSLVSSPPAHHGGCIDS